jgi:hypothetical protein
MEFLKLPHHKSNIYSWLPFFVYVLNKLYTFSMHPAVYRVDSGNIKWFMFHHVKKRSGFSVAVVCVALVLVVGLVIHFLCYLSRLLSRMALIL